MLREYLIQTARHPYIPLLMTLSSKNYDLTKEITPCLQRLVNKYSLPNYCSQCGIHIEKEDPLHYRIKSSFKKVMFYPQSFILTILLNMEYSDKNSYSVKYWDILTQKCIHSTPILETESKYNYEIHPIDFSFSPDYTKLLVTLIGRCIVVPIPLEVQEQKLMLIDNNNIPTEQL